MYKFQKNGSIFSWGDDVELKESGMCTYSIEFSNPHIEQHNAYTCISSIDDILYFYYRMKIWKTTARRGKGKKKKLVACVDTSDFPSIFPLVSILDEALNDPLAPEESLTIHGNGGISTSSKFWSTESNFVQEDVFTLSKSILREEDSKEYKPFYSLYAGCGNFMNLESEGCMFSSLMDGDLRELRECINGFVQYAINKENRKVEERVFDARNNKEVIDGMLFVYEDSKKEVVTDIIVPDNLLGRKSYDGAHSSAIIFSDKCSTASTIGINISECYGSSVVLNGSEVSVSDICYIEMAPSEELLDADERLIREDFIGIIKLSPYLQKMFINNSVQSLVQIFGSAIIGRSLMYLTDGNGLLKSDVTSTVKSVVSDIKNMLLDKSSI